jgi:CCR4-NOT transcription complex subunit 3
METFKAVEKEMKTKTYSKEGLSATTKVDPKQREKDEMTEMLQEQISKLEEDVELLEAEHQGLETGAKRKKNDGGKADRISELERIMEKHRWHISKLEMVARLLENDQIEAEQVKHAEDEIKYYVDSNKDVDFQEDDAIYDQFNLADEQELYGMNDDKESSQDGQSVQDEPPDIQPERKASGVKGKSQSMSESAPPRRPSVQLKGSMPVLSTLQSSLPNNITGKSSHDMKPAPMPSIPTGQTLKYASAAAAAAASDKNGIGITPLPPPPGAAKSSASSSPAATTAQPVHSTSSPPQAPAPQVAKVVELPKEPTPTPKEEPKAPEPAEPAPSQSTKPPSVKPSPQPREAQPSQHLEPSSSKVPQPPSPDSGIAGIALSNGEPAQEEEEEESIYHLPSSLTDLLDSFEETKKRALSDQPFEMNMLQASRHTCPTPLDAEKPNHYHPQNRYPYTPSHYPQEPLAIFDDQRLYSRIDTDSLFYAFYYQQGTYQQYLAAKALKSQSWRFHKQYQTWFQRHEEPKNITEEFEQGTYRFFDYESTWYVSTSHTFHLF